MNKKAVSEENHHAEHRRKENLRSYQRSMRQISNMERGVLKIMGLNSVPSSDVDEGNVLLEDSQPGFCYRRNGEPKVPPQRFHSMSKKAVFNIEGKEGLLPTPAQNVIGESPMMNEILSKPKLLNLLCELRNTSTLMNNTEDFKKFATVLKNHPHSELPFRDNAKTYIEAYRISLIKQFLLALKSEIDSVLKDESKTAFVLKAETRALVPQQKLTISQWNETQEEKRASIKRKEDERAKVEAEREARARAKALALELQIEAAAKVQLTEEEILHRQLKAYSVLPSLYKNRAIGFDKYRHPPNNEIPQIPVVINVLGDLLEEEPKPIEPTPSKGGNASVKQKRKDDFEAYIRGLIDNIKEVCEMGKTVKGLQRKKPQINERVANSLIKLLGKEGLFKSLNADDFAFMDYEGGKKTLEKRIAKKLNLSHNIKPGGFTFIVPSRTEFHEEIDVELDRKMNETWDKVMKPSNSNASNPKTLRPDSGESDSPTRGSKFSVQKECRSCYKKSMNRVCCPACKTKIMQQCEGIQSRNLKSLRATPTWQNSTKLFSPSVKSVFLSPHLTHHFLKSVPLATHKNYSHKFTRIENLPQKTLAEITSLNPKKRNEIKEVKSILSKKGEIKTQTRKVDFSSATKFNSKNAKEEKGPSSKPRSRMLFSTIPPAHSSSEIPSLIKYADVEANSSLRSWALHVSKMDILKLMHELDAHTVSKRKDSFEDQFFSI